MKWKLFRYILTLVSMKYIKKKNTLDILTVSFIFGHFVHGPLSSSSQSESSCLRSHRVCEVPWRSRQSRGRLVVVFGPEKRGARWSVHEGSLTHLLRSNC